MTAPENPITAATLISADREVRALLTERRPVAVAAMRQIPGFTEAQDTATHYARLQESLSQRPAVKTFRDLFTELKDRLRDGKLTPEDIAAAAASLALIDPTQRMEKAITDTLRSEMSAELSQLILHGRDVMRRHLHEELTTLLDGLSSTGIEELADAETAITAGRAEEYRALTAAARTYADIRAVQRKIDSLEGSDATRLGGSYPIASTMRGAAEHWDGFPRWAERGFRPPTVANLGAGGVEGWSAVADPMPWPPPDEVDQHAAAWLRFFLSHSDVHPWVPSQHDLDTERTHLAGVYRQAQLEAHAGLHKPAMPGSRPGGAWTPAASAYTGAAPSLNPR